MGRAYGMYGNDVYNILVAKAEVKGLLGKPSYRLDDNIEMGVTKTECEDWLLSSSSPVIGSVEHNDKILISVRGR